MRRTAIRAFRTTCQTSARCVSRGRPRRTNLVTSSSSTAPRLLGLRTVSSSSSLAARQQHHHHQHVGLSQPLQSSMYVRRLSVAVLSGLVGYGAWYSYRGNGTEQQALAYSTGAKLAGDAQPTRNVLIVSADELHTGSFVGEGPIGKTADGSGGNVLEMLTPDQATEKLRDNEASYMVNRGQGVLRYDVAQLASNNPIEDDHAEKIVEVAPTPEQAEQANRDWMFWGVFDGHAGWTTSAKLRQTLINFVARELNTTHKSASAMGAVPSPDAIDAAIKAGFTRLDDEIVHASVEKVLKSNSKRVAAELLGPALSGSCALLSFYDTSTKTLRVACTGDSRAVLGRRTDSGKWTATALSEDQTGSNPNEIERMQKAHPGERQVIRNGRVLGGLEPTRAFGDASYKWTREISDRLRSSFFGRSYSPHLQTPPYVTAEPVVTTTKIQPEKGDFVVMATDGLWEMLTNEEVVGLVGKWIETQAVEQSGSQLGAVWSKLFGTSQALPVEAAAAAADDGQKTPIRVRQWGIAANDDRFLVADKNVATHLMRNALGGRNEEQVCALLTLVSPFSRRYRDDLTVQVIFFGHGQKTTGGAGAEQGNGEVLVNADATTPPKSAGPGKTKL